ncbi:dienelactone hydrolase family protein [Pseudonocardia zijingensis]
MALHDYQVGEAAEDHADGGLSRREALRRLALLGLGVTSAGGLLAACAVESPPTRAAPAPGAEPPGRAPTVGPGQEIRFPGPAGELIGSWAAPAGRPGGAVLVVHENEGLTRHFHDLVGRLAGAGYAALCVDLLSARGGTSAIADDAQAPPALADTPVEVLLADLRAGIDELGRRAPGAGLGVVGFQFGGGMTWQLLEAGEPRLRAAVPFYGPVPERPDFAGVTAAVLAVYAGDNAGVNEGQDRAEAALEAAGATHWTRTFEGAQDAFFNDTGPRYDDAAASQAYTEMLDWFDRYLE